ncbi:hypothetical protein AB0D12_35920 [Streptomyces sp. NPDC048479]|uniref:hypothetical protein n=1 Tax=Streptomyces sp. NPDC048479 TaxID=3154725 RepID=UPI003438F8AE
MPAADRDGAVFGMWEGRHCAGRRPQLRTRDAFDATIFYAEVFGWAGNEPGSCEVAGST